jgi:hypothetical protein
MVPEFLLHKVRKRKSLLLPILQNVSGYEISVNQNVLDVKENPHFCYCSVKVSPSTCSVKMSPYERKGDIELKRAKEIESAKWGYRLAGDGTKGSRDVGAIVSSCSAVTGRLSSRRGRRSRSRTITDAHFIW